MAGDYKAKWILSSKVRQLFVGKKGGEDIKIRIAGDAKPLIYKHLDEAVENAVQELIDKLPRKQKGPNKGEFKRITIQPDDLNE